jgi:hypothetical protein
MVTPEPEPCVHPYTLGRRVENLVTLLQEQQAKMESSPLAAVSYTLTMGLLLDLMPELMLEHRRMAGIVNRDPAACYAVYLGCHKSADTPHLEHYDVGEGIEWTRGRNGLTMTYRGH